MSLRERRAIHTPVAFITTQVEEPDKDDWGKIKHVFQYFNGTRCMKLTLSIDDLSVINWFVDPSHLTHCDYKGDTRASMTFGKETVTSMSTKEKINTKSSTGSEILGADNILP